MVDKISKADDEWRAALSEEAFHILRKHGTERPFTGLYNDCKDEGTYVCAGCGHPLFSSAHKFDSGTGWPSFYRPIDNEAVGTRNDWSMLMRRTEVHCARCEGHLGHVFPDGPMPSGERYCINSVSLRLEPATD